MVTAKSPVDNRGLLITPEKLRLGSIEYDNDGAIFANTALQRGGPIIAILLDQQQWI